MKRRTMLVGIVAMVASAFAAPAMAAFPEKPDAPGHRHKMD